MAGGCQNRRMDPTRLHLAANLDDAESTRRAGRELLSLALIDARNRTLRWLAAFEAAGQLGGAAGHPALPWRLLGRAGWFAEYWIARNLRRGQGEVADSNAPRLASLEPRADDWFDGRIESAAASSPTSGSESAGATDAAPDASTLRTYLADTLEVTLELLASNDETDAALHFFRLALLHEDRLAETLAVAAQWLDVNAGDEAHPCGPPPARAQRAPLWLPAGVFMLGSQPGGLVPPNERWAHAVELPECEIDAQPVSWARYIEFAEDGGYDDCRLWSAAGWAWAQAEGRRAPRGVEQLRGGVLLRRRGAMQRAPAAQAAVHLSWYEADAWCRWAGRRLATEPEWELAACTAASRGFVWGDVAEWVGGSARAWPGGDSAGVAGFSPLPGSTVATNAEPAARVLRGASSWAVSRCRHPRARRFVGASRDDLFAGFRSCAM